MAYFFNIDQLLSEEIDKDEVDQDEVKMIDTPQQTNEDQLVAIIEVVEQTDDLAVARSSITIGLSVYDDLDGEPRVKIIFQILEHGQPQVNKMVVQPKE